MKLGQRLFYYLGGFAVGLIILFFFLGGKKTSCDYGPSSRVLKNIRIKEKVFSEEAALVFDQSELDSTDLKNILTEGDVNFSKSNTKLDSCRTYFIEGSTKDKKVNMLIENCDSIAKIKTFHIK